MICTRCGKDKSEEEFVWKYKNVRRASQCNTCTRQNSKDHYNKNKNYYYLRNKKRKDDGVNISLICEYLSSHPCVDCGESDIVVLDFDHVRGVKRVPVTLMEDYSKESLMKEIEKCEIRCSNCHRRRHAKEMESYKFMFNKRNLID